MSLTSSGQQFLRVMVEWRRLSLTTSNPLEIAVTLPVGNGVVEGPHLQPRGVRVKIDDRVTERPAGELAALEQVGGFMQRFRQAGQIGIDVGVALVFLATIELFFDAGHAGGERRG